MRQYPGHLTFMSVDHWRDYKIPIEIGDDIPACRQTTSEQ